MTTRELRQLLRALLQTSSKHLRVDHGSLQFLELGGGYSGAFVALVWVDGLPTLILKAGPSERMQKEVAGRREFSSNLGVLENLGLTGCSEPVEVEVDGREESWRAMAYPYIGGLTYHDAIRFSDFEVIFQEFVAPRSDAMHIGQESLQDWLRSPFQQIRSRQREGADPNPQHSVRHRPLASFLPALPWNEGLSALLCTAAVFVPEGEELLNLREWWEETSKRQSIAQIPNKTTLHGDLRFANVLVNRRNGQVELIDFGGVREDHVFRDLAKFECDLLFRIIPSGPSAGGTRRLYPEERRTNTLERAFGRHFMPPDDELDLGNTHLKAVQSLRAVYNSIWNISQYDDGQNMYLGS